MVFEEISYITDNILIWVTNSSSKHLFPLLMWLSPDDLLCNLTCISTKPNENGVTMFKSYSLYELFVIFAHKIL